MNLPKDFNWKIYIYLNKDISGSTDKKDKKYIKKCAIDHFLNYGHKEKRRYKFENVPCDFNYKTYIKINKPILKEIVKNNEKKDDELYLQILDHYNNIGFYNKLSYKLEENIIVNTLNTIIHITHNFNGGTNVYIENLKNIYNKFEHIVINIVSENIIKIKDKNYDIDNLHILKNAIVISHHLLYFDLATSKYKINK